MAVDDFLNSYYKSFEAKNQTPPPLIQSSGNSPSAIREASKINFTAPPSQTGPAQGAPSNGSAIQQVLGFQQNKSSQAFNGIQSQNQARTQTMYNTFAPGMDTNSYGLLKTAPAMANRTVPNQYGVLDAADEMGRSALQNATFAAAQKRANLLSNYGADYNVGASGAGYDPSLLPAGSGPNNIGAQALATAMTAYKNGTPYVWGGNSLTSGVDCSGLVQQAYAKMGLQLPRTTYEQAKSGHVVRNVNQALPGDLVFYNTGSSDPNGIGTYGHVGIYMGNGQILEAKGRQYGIRISGIGNYSLIVRPW